MVMAEVRSEVTLAVPPPTVAEEERRETGLPAEECTVRVLGQSWRGREERLTAREGNPARVRALHS